MSEEAKVENTPNQENLFNVLDTSLSSSMKRLCLSGLEVGDNSVKINSLLDASIKFHQLTLSINALEEQRRKEEMRAMADIKAKEEMLTAKAD